MIAKTKKTKQREKSSSENQKKKQKPKKEKKRNHILLFIINYLFLINLQYWAYYDPVKTLLDLPT